MNEKQYYISTILLIILTAAVAGILGYFTGQESQSAATSRLQTAFVGPLIEEKKAWGQSFNIGDDIFLTVAKPEATAGSGPIEASVDHGLARSRVVIDNKGRFTADFNNLWSRLTLITSDNREDFHTMLTFGVTATESNREAFTAVAAGRSAEGYVTYEVPNDQQVVSIAYIGEKVKVVFGR